MARRRPGRRHERGSGHRPDNEELDPDGAQLYDPAMAARTGHRALAGQDVIEAGLDQLRWVEAEAGVSHWYPGCRSQS